MDWKERDEMTRKVLREMFTENTGTHFLDSGGAYGRHWQQNQGRDFENEPVGRLIDCGKWWSPSLNTYHWLAERLCYEPQGQAHFEQWVADNTEERDSWGLCREEYMDFLRKEHEAGGIYGDGKPFSVNTYNGECILDQTLLFGYFECDTPPFEAEVGPEFVLLQVHGGCDVRGGYTAPKLFSVTEELAILSFADACMGHAEPEPHWWRTDCGGYHWYDDDCGPQENFDLMGVGYHIPIMVDERTPPTETGLELSDTYYDNYARTMAKLWGKDQIFVDVFGKARCPVCGEPLEIQP